MRQPRVQRIWVGFVLAIAVIALLAIVSYQNNGHSSETSRLEAHANDVRFHSEQILSLTVDLESGQRAYSLTGISAFLEPGTNAAERLFSHTRSLKQLVSDNPGQQRRLALLHELIVDKVEFTARAIAARDILGLSAAQKVNASMQGERLKDEIRRLVNELQYEEQKLSRARTAALTARINSFNTYFAFMLFVTAVIVSLLFYAVYVNLRERSRAEASLESAAMKIQDIYEHAPCGYHSIDADGILREMNATWLEWLKYSREEVVNKLRFSDILTPSSAAVFKVAFPRFKSEGSIRDQEFEVARKDGTTFPVLINSSAVYDQHGNFIKSRSTALDYSDQKRALEKIAQLNRELESFSYSVSHDLRAPLRSIDGYSQILLDDYSERLGPEGERLLNVVINNARKMFRLIDDLLEFSRIGRGELNRVEVNTHGLVMSVLNELHAANSDRKVNVEMVNLPVVNGDPNLLRQVWVNLLSNAFKYTRKKDVARIEIEFEQGHNEKIFTVRDNGAGFDMQYAGKLFGVFQRLHRQNDFEGTGVGLAIVHRIISRHGGRVWAEAKPGEGAAFYFSLPD